MSSKTMRKLSALTAAGVFSCGVLGAADVVWDDGSPREIPESVAYDSLAVKAATTVTIPAGVTLTVGDYVGAAALVKDGEGTLVLKNHSADSVLTAKAGVIRFAAGGSTDVAALAGAAYLHVDASDAETLTKSTPYEGMPTVTKWADVRGDGRPYAAASANYFKVPYLRAALLNGRDVLDFGSTWVLNERTTGYYGGVLDWNEKSDDVRDVIMVHGDGDLRRQFFLGCKVNGNAGSAGGAKYDFARGPNGAFFSSSAASASLRSGGIYADGVSYAAADVISEGFHVLRFAPTGPVHASAFANDRCINIRGGQLLGEVCVFTNALESALARRIEMRMQRKWLPDAFSCARLSLEGSARAMVDAGVTVTAADFSCAEDASVGGEGVLCIGGESSRMMYYVNLQKLVKSGNGTLTVRSTPARALSVGCGRLEVLSGVGKLTPFVHLDASAPAATSFSSYTQAGDDKTYVYRWNDVRGEGREYATYNKTAGNNPNIVSGGLNGRTYLDFRSLYVQTQKASDDTGSAKLSLQSPVTTVRDAFAVVADSDDARAWMNDSRAINCFFGAAGTDGSGHTIPAAYQQHYSRGTGGRILSTQVGVGSREGTTVQLDGKTVPVDTVCPEGFHLVRISTTTDAALCTLGADRSWFIGGLKYAEVLVYTNAPADEAEASALTAYLMNKWGIGDAKAMAPSYGPVAVANGATLVLPDWAKVAELSIPDADHLGARIASKIQVDENFKVSAGKLEGVKKGDTVCLIEADEIVGSLPATSVACGSENKFNMRLYIEGGKLMAECCSRGLGLCIIFR